jgi:isoleucyl-tRNA synthetase
MHGSWGNTIVFDDAVAQMGADVMRWQYCAQPPDRNLLFGFGPAQEIKRKLLTLWNSVSFFVEYANIAGFTPSWDALAPATEAPLDRWLVERTHAFVADATAGYDAWLTVNVMRDFEAYLDDLSNWYIRRSRRRFWDGGDEAALRTLWYALVQTLRVIAPILPFVTEHLWRTLVLDGPESVHLAPWPETAPPDRALLDEIAEVRLVVELGRQARSTAGIKHRQPLRTAIVEGATLSDEHVDEFLDELRVKSVVSAEGEAPFELRVKPNLPVLGPKLGKELGAVRAALEAGEFEELPGGRFRVDGHELGPDEVLVERTGREGWAVASANGVSVAIDTSLDADLRLEGEGYDLIHLVNSMRREQGLELTDRIRVTVPESQREVAERHGDWIAGEVLATEIRVEGDAPSVTKA